jgi:hypothetical protein
MQGINCLDAIVTEAMATLSCKKLALIEEELRQRMSDEMVSFALDTIKSHLDFDAYLQKQRDLHRQASEKLKEQTGTTYNDAGRSYYERNKAILNRKRTELNRRKRAEAAAAAAAASASASASESR